jgi:hypothetical protein
MIWRRTLRLAPEHSNAAFQLVRFFADLAEFVLKAQGWATESQGLRRVTVLWRKYGISNLEIPASLNATLKMRSGVDVRRPPASQKIENQNMTVRKLDMIGFSAGFVLSAVFLRPDFFLRRFLLCVFTRLRPIPAKTTA